MPGIPGQSGDDPDVYDIQDLTRNARYGKAAQQYESSYESVFTDAVMMMLQWYLSQEAPGSDGGYAARMERVDENRFLWRYGDKAMSITINQVEV